jgi:hypothetical protein
MLLSIKKLIPLLILALLMSSKMFSQTLVLNKKDTTICFSLNQGRYLLKQVYRVQEFDTLYGNRVTEEGRERNWDVLINRSRGATLLQAGAPYSLTRERVRQIEAKFLRILAVKIRNA